MAPDGWVVNPSLAAGPTVIVKLVLAAVASDPDVAVRVYIPGLLTLQPANVASPETAFLGFAVQLRTAPEGEPVMLSVTAAVLDVVLPLASWMATTGCDGKAMPPVESVGPMVKASLDAVPPVMLKLALIPAASVPEVAVRVRVPVLLLWQPEQEATPADADLGWLVQLRVAPPVGAVIFSVMAAELPVMVLPPASCTATTGWTPNTAFTAVSVGEVVKPSLAAGPIVIVTVVLTALVRGLLAAVSV